MFSMVCIFNVLILRSDGARTLRSRQSINIRPYGTNRSNLSVVVIPRLSLHRILVWPHRIEFA